MAYEVKPDIADLRAFGAPCAIVEPGARLQKLDDRATMCIFIGYKYGGGGYRVWDPRKSMDVTFFEEGLPPPTYRDLAAQPISQRYEIAPDEPLSLPAAAPASQEPSPAPPGLPGVINRCWTDRFSSREDSHSSEVSGG